MKLFILLALCALGAAATSAGEEISFDFFKNTSDEDLNNSIDILIQQMINYIRHVIKYGSLVFDYPPLDPLELDHYHLNIPAGLINLNLELRNSSMLGLGNFVVHKSYLRLPDLCLYVDASVPKLHISTDLYDLDGDVFAALPLYGKGKAVFEVEEFRVQGEIFLKRSDNGKSILIDRIENPAFQLPTFKSNLDGAIGGGDIDAIVNSIIEEVIIEYINRFEGVISKIGSEILVDVANPYLDQLDTWRYIDWLF